jgi:cell division protein FtsL
MGHAVRKHEPTTRTARVQLRLMPRVAPRGRTASRSRACVARQNCVLFAVAVTVLALLGVGRIWLSVEAAQASLRSTELKKSIKSERYRGDMLEVRQSALGSPSRIRTIAGRAMNMAPATSVTYLDLTGEQSEPQPSSEERAGGRSVGAVLGTLLDLTAGEAQVLLVGDVGLASAR